MPFRAKLINYLCSRDRGWVLSLLLATSALYLPFLGSPFIFDDVLFFFGGSAHQYAQSDFNLQLRWLPYASLGWTEVAFSNVATHFFHLGNLLLHATSTILLFYLLRQVVAAVLSEQRSATTGWACWFAALIFALHPVAVYAVGYVVQRSILMATLFALVMQLSYLRGLLTGQARWLALAVVAYFLAVYSKEHSVMMPAVLAAMTLMLRGKIRTARLSMWSTWIAFGAIALLIILRAKGVLGTPYEAMAGALFEQQGVAGSDWVLHLLSILTQAGLFFKYLSLWLLPNPAWMSIDMREPFVSSLGQWQGWLGAAGFLIYGAIALRLLLGRGRAALVGFALLYPWLQFILEFSSIRVQEPFVLYRSYLWMPGMLLLLPLLVQRWSGRHTWFALGGVVLLLACAAGNRLWVMADNYRLWNDAARLLPREQVPGADRIYFNLAQAEAGIGLRDEAVADFKRSLAISPQYAQVHFELGWLYVTMGHYDQALDRFNEAIRLDPTYANAYYGKGMVLKMRHEDKQAMELMVRSCELKFAMACLIAKGKMEH